MKKLFLIVALLVVGLFSYASDVTLSGDFSYGFSVNLEDLTEKGAAGTVNMSAVIDDVNKVNIAHDMDVLTKITLTTDWGVWAGLEDFGIVSEIGYFDASVGKVDLTITPNDMFTCGTVFNVDPDLYNYLIDATLKISPVTILVSYDTAGYEDLIGKVKGDVDLALTLTDDLSMTTGVDCTYNLQEGIADGDIVGFNLFAGITGYSIFGAKISYSGNDLNVANTLTANVDLHNADSTLGGDIDVKLSMAEGTDLFQGADLSGYMKINTAKLRAGYHITDIGAGASNAPVTLTEGGAYMNLSISY